LSLDSKTLVSAQELATKGQAILATRGAGKSYLAALQAEQLIEAGYPVLVLDVVGEYWSLKAEYPVVVFGGAHADVPLDPHIGAEIARTLLDKRLQTVVDLTGMRRADQPFFIADLCTELYEYGLKVKRPVWLLIEEAQNFIPQIGNPACKRPILDIVEMGRHAGIGYCLVSHRSATIDKTALGLCEIVVFKRLTLPHDLTVVRDFFKGKNPEFVDIAKELPGLSNDEALIYYPVALDEPVKFKVAHRKAPHAAETPTLELEDITTVPEVSALSQELTAYFQELIQKKVASRDETEELKARVDELQKELDTREQRISQLEHDLELAQRFKIEIPSEILKIPGFTQKVEYLEKQLLDLYQKQSEKARKLEEENQSLKSQLESLKDHVDFVKGFKQLQSLQGEFERLRKPLSELLEILNTVSTRSASTMEGLEKLSDRFIGLDEHKHGIQQIRDEYEDRLESMRKAEEWRLNPNIIVRMSRIVEEINQLPETGKQVLKTVASTSPDVAFDKKRVAQSVGRTTSTVHLYLRELTNRGWVEKTGSRYKNNVGSNITRRLEEVHKTGQEEIPNIVIQRCKRELLTFIQSL